MRPGDYNFVLDNFLSNIWEGGIVVSGCNNIVSGNIIRECNEGINLYGHSNTLSKNTIWAEDTISLSGSCKNIIIYNNFMNKDNNAFFINSFFTFWCRNYWGDWLGLVPRPIVGIIGSEIFLIAIPWVNFDWYPAREPYEWWLNE